MTEQEAIAAVDATIAATAAAEQPTVGDASVPDQPTIDTSWMDDATTEEPILNGPTTFLGTLAKFGPGARQDGTIYGWKLDVTSDVKIPHNLGGTFEPGKSFPFLSVFTTASEGSTPDQVKQTNGRVLKMLATLYGVATTRQDSAATIKARLLALGVPLVPSPTDPNPAHYAQHVGKKFNFTLKPDKVSDKGYMQYKLIAMTIAPGVTPSAF